MPNNEWDDLADGWDENHLAVAYADRAFEELAKTVKLDGLDVFDFGCGTGLLAERISPFANRIVALDSSPKMIDRLARKSLTNVLPVTGLLTAVRVKTDISVGSKFDLVTASSVCAFVPDYDTTLRIIKSLIRPDGTYVQWDWLVDDDEPGFGFSPQEIDGALDKAGFIDIEISQPFDMEGRDGGMPVLMAVAKIV